MSNNLSEFSDNDSDTSLTQKERQQATSLRHSLMLKAMTLARKSFQEATRAELPHGYIIEADIGDRDGWPYVSLKLLSLGTKPLKLPYLDVSSTDADSKGLVQFSLSTGEVLGRINLRSEKDFPRVPLFVKRSVREFLELCEVTCNRIGFPEGAPRKGEKPGKETDVLLMKADLFSEDYNQQSLNKEKHSDNVEPLDSLDDIVFEEKRIQDNRNLIPHEEEVEPLEPIELF